jgi:hypothetical protein
MTFSRHGVLAALFVLCVLGEAGLSAQSPSDLTGSWTLNRQLSQFPQEVGFSASFFPAEPGARGGGRGGNRGGRGRGGGNAGDGDLRVPRIQTGTEEDARRMRFLTDEVRLPPDRLTIMVTPATVTITPDRGAARTVQFGRRDEDVRIGPVTAITNTSWESDHLTIVYKAETGRLLRYTYSVSQNPVQLVVDVEFVERENSGDKVRRIYEPTPQGEPVPAPSTSAVGTPASPGQLLLPPGATGSAGSRSAGSRSAGSRPAPSLPAAAAVDQRPDAALKGLTRLGVVLEGLGADAAKCGLKEGVLETAIEKRLTDAGFRVVRESDDDTYLYVNINTVTASAALCVSRYDVTLYSHATAQLTHTASPVPLQAELLHRGGIAGGGPAPHADAVTKGVLEYVEQFATRMRNAGQ